MYVITETLYKIVINRISRKSLQMTPYDILAATVNAEGALKVMMKALTIFILISSDIEHKNKNKIEN